MWLLRDDNYPPADPKERDSQPFGKWIAHFVRTYFLDPFVSSNSPPWFDARGIGLGLFVGFGVPIGLQLLVLGLIRGFFKFNVLMAFAFTWVNNPITVIPLYYGYYYLGSMILGRGAILSPQAFHDVMDPIIHAEYFWQSVDAFLLLGWDFVLRWSVTALAVGVTTGIAGYAIGYHIQQNHCRRKAATIGMSYERLVRDLEEKLDTEKTPKRL